MQLHALEPLFKIFLCKNFSSSRLNFPEKTADDYIENLKKAAEKI